MSDYIKITRIVRRNSGMTEDHHWIPSVDWEAMSQQERDAVLPLPPLDDRDVIDQIRTVTDGVGRP